MYAELHCHTNYSFQEGASSTGDLLLRAMVDRPQLAALDEAGRAEESRFVVAMLLRMLGR